MTTKCCQILEYIPVFCSGQIVRNRIVCCVDEIALGSSGSCNLYFDILQYSLHFTQTNGNSETVSFLDFETIWVIFMKIHISRILFETSVLLMWNGSHTPEHCPWVKMLIRFETHLLYNSETYRWLVIGNFSKRLNNVFIWISSFSFGMVIKLTTPEVRYPIDWHVVRYPYPFLMSIN